jgi:hypothetical protein
MIRKMRICVTEMRRQPAKKTRIIEKEKMAF